MALAEQKNPKPTSFAYGEAYQSEQVQKHRNRHQNHWMPRIALAHKLVDTFVLPRLGPRAPAGVTVLDVGCSIGTMAIEMALRGFNAYGVDFDSSALAIARELAAEEHAKVQFYLGDVAEWRSEIGAPVDIAVCFDIFEHLHDDELGSLLQSIRRQLGDKGALIFFTFPLQYDYLFFSRDMLHWPLLPFRWVRPRLFERLTRAYASILDGFLLLATGQSYKDRISHISHCNPTTVDRLTLILERAGFEIETIESTNIYPFKSHVLRRFGHQPVAHRNLFGVAYPARSRG